MWLDRLLDTFEVGDAVPVERALGAWDAAADAQGAHIVTYLNGDKSCASSGGEAAYLLKPGLSDDGFASLHQAGSSGGASSLSDTGWMLRATCHVCRNTGGSARLSAAYCLRRSSC